MEFTLGTCGCRSESIDIPVALFLPFLSLLANIAGLWVARDCTSESQI